MDKANRKYRQIDVDRTAPKVGDSTVFMDLDDPNGERFLVSDLTIDILAPKFRSEPEVSPASLGRHLETARKFAAEQGISLSDWVRCAVTDAVVTQRKMGYGGE